MPESERRKAGLAKFKEVYAGQIPAPPAGQSAFFDVMLEQLFGEVWTRPALPLRERRLLTMGVVAAVGDPRTFGIQVRAAITNGELDADQVREILIHLAQYAGYPRAAALLPEVERVLAELAAEPDR